MRALVPVSDGALASDEQDAAAAGRLSLSLPPRLRLSPNGATMVRMRTRLCILASFLSVAFLGGCGGGSDGPKCIPGLTVECPCPTSQHGAQTCNASGTFAACVCATPTLDAGGLGGAGGTMVPPTSSGTGGQVAALPDAGAGGTGGVIVPVTSLADASTTASETGVQTITDSGVSAEVGALDASQAVAVCGDGITLGPETCDDGNTVNGDGCSSTCHLEFRYKCSGSPSKCSPTVCGDGKKEGAEGCDDGNTMPFDGCSEDCQIEPNCSGTSGCTSQCGDGIIMGSEQCDDGNAASGDGCSSTCQIEPGWTCTQPPIGNEMMVPAVYRDFKFQNPTDFEAGITGQTTASAGIVNPDLDADGKPVFTGLTGGAIHVASQSTFAEWYRNTPGINHATASKLTLWNNGQGAYVNRNGANGDQWAVTEPAYFCGDVGMELMDSNGSPIPCTTGLSNTTDCDKEVAAGKVMLPGSCTIANGSYTARFIVSKMDGNPLFFPVDGDSFTPASELHFAQVPPYYDPQGTWPHDVDPSGKDILHNFSFTSEVRYWFEYETGKSYQLNFVGNDDVWVFINKKLAVDLGGIHTPVEGSVTIDGTTASKFGLANGNVYEIAVFYAQRQTTGAALELTLPAFNTAPSVCTPL